MEPRRREPDHRVAGVCDSERDGGGGRGRRTSTLGANGALSVALVPNAGATPAGVYYTVVYQIGPGRVKTEYWVVPTTSPANLATVRTTPGSGVAGQPVSLQYVNSELATKANDSAVVHLAGTETISGAKTFSAAPSVPAPTGSGAGGEQGLCGYVGIECGSGKFTGDCGRNDDGTDHAAGKSGVAAAGCDQTICGYRGSGTRLI